MNFHYNWIRYTDRNITSSVPIYKNEGTQLMVYERLLGYYPSNEFWSRGSGWGHDLLHPLDYRLKWSKELHIQRLDLGCAPRRMLRNVSYLPGGTIDWIPYGIQCVTKLTAVLTPHSISQKSNSEKRDLSFVISIKNLT